MNVQSRVKGYAVNSVSRALKDGIRWDKVLMKANPWIKPVTTPADQLEDHSPIGFSGWDRHSACHGSVALATLCPKPAASFAADEGTLAHAIAAEWLMRGYAPKGADAAMENHIRAYVYAVWDKLPAVHKSGYHHIWMVEGRVAAPSIHPDCRGTVDTLIWDDVEKVLQIHDLKYGKWPVSAENNVQLMGYAVCARETWPQIKPKRIDLYIHQVRISKKPDMWSCEPMDLDLFEDEIREHVEAIEAQKKILATTKDPKKLDLRAGDHCKFCPAWSMCEERKTAASREAIDLLVPKPDELPKDAARIVAFAAKALPWARMVLNNAKRHLMQGGTIPGFKLVKGKRKRAATLDDETLAEVLTTEVDLDGLGLRPEQIMAKPKLKTIPQIEEVIPKDQKKAFDKLWEWQDGAPQLAEESDKRPALKIRPEDYFSVIEDQSEDDEDTE